MKVNIAQLEVSSDTTHVIVLRVGLLGDSYRGTFSPPPPPPPPPPVDISSLFQKTLSH